MFTFSVNILNFVFIFGKKLLRAYVVLFYYVPNQNKVFLSYLILYKQKLNIVIKIISGVDVTAGPLARGQYVYGRASQTEQRSARWAS